MFQNLNKGISTPIGILIIVLVAVIAVGGILFFYKSVECYSPIDCESKTHIMCVGQWGCVDYKCVWSCETGEIIKDETSDWKTYRNEEYEFEVKYPNNWEISRRASFVADFRHQEMEKNHACISIRFEEFLGSSIEEHLKKQGDQYTLSKVKCLEEEKFTLVSIDGKEALRCEDLPDPFPTTAILLSTNNFIYHIEKIDTEICRNFDTEKVFNQILSTFRFLD